MWARHRLAYRCKMVAGILRTSTFQPLIWSKWCILIVICNPDVSARLLAFGTDRSNAALGLTVSQPNRTNATVKVEVGAVKHCALPDA